MPGEPERRPYHTELYLLGRLEKQQKRRDGVRSTARKIKEGQDVPENLRQTVAQLPWEERLADDYEETLYHVRECLADDLQSEARRVREEEANKREEASRTAMRFLEEEQRRASAAESRVQAAEAELAKAKRALARAEQDIQRVREESAQALSAAREAAEKDVSAAREEAHQAALATKASEEAHEKTKARAAQQLSEAKRSAADHLTRTLDHALQRSAEVAAMLVYFGNLFDLEPSDLHAKGHERRRATALEPPQGDAEGTTEEVKDSAVVLLEDDVDGLARFFRQWTLAQTGATHADRAAEVRQQALQLLREAVGLGNAREPRGKKPSRRGRGRGGRGRNRPTAEEGATTPETPDAAEGAGVGDEAGSKNEEAAAMLAIINKVASSAFAATVYAPPPPPAPAAPPAPFPGPPAWLPQPPVSSVPPPPPSGHPVLPGYPQGFNHNGAFAHGHAMGAAGMGHMGADAMGYSPVPVPPASFASLTGSNSGMRATPNSGGAMPYQGHVPSQVPGYPAFQTPATDYGKGFEHAPSTDGAAARKAGGPHGHLGPQPPAGDRAVPRGGVPAAGSNFEAMMQSALKQQQHLPGRPAPPPAPPAGGDRPGVPGATHLGGTPDRTGAGLVPNLAPGARATPSPPLGPARRSVDSREAGSVMGDIRRPPAPADRAVPPQADAWAGAFPWGQPQPLGAQASPFVPSAPFTGSVPPDATVWAPIDLTHAGGPGVPGLGANPAPHHASVSDGSSSLMGDAASVPGSQSFGGRMGDSGWSAQGPFAVGNPMVTSWHLGGPSAFLSGAPAPPTSNAGAGTGGDPSLWSGPVVPPSRRQSSGTAMPEAEHGAGGGVSPWAAAAAPKGNPKSPAPVPEPASAPREKGYTHISDKSKAAPPLTVTPVPASMPHPGQLLEETLHTGAAGPARPGQGSANGHGHGVQHPADATRAPGPRPSGGALGGGDRHPRPPAGAPPKAPRAEPAAVADMPARRAAAVPLAFVPHKDRRRPESDSREGSLGGGSAYANPVVPVDVASRGPSSSSRGPRLGHEDAPPASNGPRMIAIETVQSRAQDSRAGQGRRSSGRGADLWD